MCEQSFFDYLKKERERLLQLGRIRASENCHAASRSLLAFWGDTDLTFDCLNTNLMEAYESYLKRRGVLRNTSSYYMRCLRSVYNRAVEEGMVIDQHPFQHVFTACDKTAKRALDRNTIMCLRQLDLSKRPALEFARDVFLLSFFTRGMSFVDLAYLRKTDLRGHYLIYSRRKTGQVLQVEWLPCMQKLIDKYPPNPTPYLLPIITNPEQDDRQQYLYRLRAVNRNLKAVAECAKLSVHLSSYYARHSWASLVRNMKVHISVISEALGHTNQSTTQIYLDSISSAVVDDTNRRLLEQLGF